MELNPIFDAFYRSILDQMGLAVQEDASIVKLSSNPSPLKTKGGKHYYLPYLSHTSSPEGKQFFHPLHEKYLDPESETFNIVRNNLTLMINLKFAGLMDLLIEVGCNGPLHKKIKSPILESIVGSMGEMEDSFKGMFTDKILGKATQEYGLAPYIDFDIVRDGKVDGVVHNAVGKVVWNIVSELEDSLSQSGSYSFYGVKVRKKDILMIEKLFRAVFPQAFNEGVYVETTDNKVFSFLNALLKTSYMVTSRIDEVATAITNDLKLMEDVKPLNMNHDWVALLPEIYEMGREIGILGNLDDVRAEAAIKRIGSDEGSSVNEQPVYVAPASTGSATSFAPPKSMVPMPTTDAPPTFVPVSSASGQQPQYATPQQPQVNPQVHAGLPGMLPMSQAPVMDPNAMAPQQPSNVGLMQQKINEATQHNVFPGMNPGMAMANPMMQQQMVMQQLPGMIQQLTMNPQVQMQLSQVPPMMQQQYLQNLAMQQINQQMMQPTGPMNIQSVLQNPQAMQQMVMMQQMQQQQMMQQQQTGMINPATGMPYAGNNMHPSEQDKLNRMLQGRPPSPGARPAGLNAQNAMLNQHQQQQNQAQIDAVSRMTGLSPWVIKLEQERLAQGQ